MNRLQYNIYIIFSHLDVIFSEQCFLSRIHLAIDVYSFSYWRFSQNRR